LSELDSLFNNKEGKAIMSEQGQPNVKELQEKAVRYFCDRPGNFPTGRPYNCCESVLLTLTEYLGIKSEMVPKIGTAIGAGVGLNGLLCGSISSVAMAIGMKYGRTSPEQSPQPVWSKIDEYVTAFKEKFGAVNCRQLTGVDVKTPAGWQEYVTKIHDYKCTERLKFAVEKGIEILSK
jgi:C_GCAxxG_C_C family probable redox protein